MTFFEPQSRRGNGRSETGAHLGNGHRRTLADDGQNIFLRFTDSAVIIFAAAPFRLQ